MPGPLLSRRARLARLPGHAAAVTLRNPFEYRQLLLTGYLGGAVATLTNCLGETSM